MPMGVPTPLPAFSGYLCGPMDDVPVETCFRRNDGAPLRQGAELQLQLMLDFSLPNDIFQVVNRKTGCVHLVKVFPNAICNSWRCGSFETPVSNAEFAESNTLHNGATSPFAFCRVCFTEKAFTRNGASRISDVVDSAGESESVSSSGPDSSS